MSEAYAQKEAEWQCIATCSAVGKGPQILNYPNKTSLWSVTKLCTCSKARLDYN